MVTRIPAQDATASLQPELDDELRQAEQDFACGDFVEVTVEQLGRCIASGRWPWPEESSG